MNALIHTALNTALSITNTTTNQTTLTPLFIRVIDPWVPTIDTLATITGDGIGLIVKVVQLGVAIRQLHALFRIENGESST